MNNTASNVLVLSGLAAPVHLRPGRQRAEDDRRLPGQAEEAGQQRPCVAAADDHGGPGRIPGAQRHRDQGRSLGGGKPV